jgi:riboflavin synthase
VDATGEIVSIRKTDLAWIFRFQAPAEYDRYLIDKGSVCVDGISLTVVEPKDGAFDVWVIPHTFEVTNFRAAQPGDLVNLEFDVIAKYLEKLAQPFLERLLRERSS